MYSILLYTKHMERRYEVVLSKSAQKQIKRLPEHIRKSLRTWVEIIEDMGMPVMRRIPGYHDEPLKGDRRGQRSSRLNVHYRVIYVETDRGELVIVSILEVNKHVY